MNRYVEISALTLGALALFAVSFLGFAAMSGTPMGDVAIVGALFADGEQEGERVLTEAAAQRPSGPQSDQEVLKSQVGVLSAWVLDAPFSDGQLQQLVDEIKARQIALDEREAAVTGREAELEVRRETVYEQLKILERIRADLEEKKRELLLLQQEVSSDSRARSDEGERALRTTADLFKTGAAEELVTRLQQFEPDEAAVILLALNKERAAELLNALPDGRWREYQAAYTKRAPATP